MDSSIFEMVWIIMIALNGLEWIDWLHVKNMGKLHRRAVSGLDSWKILDSRSSRARIFSFCLLKPDPRHLMAFSPPINVHLEAYRNINCLLFLLQMPKTDPPHLAANWAKKIEAGPEDKRNIIPRERLQTLFLSTSTSSEVHRM